MAKRVKVESIEDVRRHCAKLQGLMSRVHGHLGLSGESFPDREKALEAWCLQKDRDLLAGEKEQSE